jgi:hypothetical protein
MLQAKAWAPARRRPPRPPDASPPAGGAPLPCKQRLLQLLAGHWGSVALSAPGSFLAEKAYSWADVPGKERVVEQLLARQRELEGSYWGPQVGCWLG